MINMTKYHVSASLFGIYAGRINKNGDILRKIEEVEKA